MQTIGARFAHGEITLEQAAEAGCRACASPGGGCQFLGTAATSQVVGEALGMSLPPLGAGAVGSADLARHGAALGARAHGAAASAASPCADILTDAAIDNAMVVHAAFGGSHEPAPAHARHRPRRRPASARPSHDWTRVNRQVPRLVDALPNGPRSHPTVRVFLAGGVPEVMLHLRRAGLLDTSALTASGETLGAKLDWWEESERRARLRGCSSTATASNPDDVIMSPTDAAARGLTSTVMLPGRQPCARRLGHQEHGDRSVGRGTPTACTGRPARRRVFTSEKAAIAAIKDAAHRGRATCSC